MLRRFSYGLLGIIILPSLYSGKILAQSSSEDITHYLNISEEIAAPLRLAANRKGIIYVTDAISDKIYKYDEEGSFLGYLEDIRNPLSVAVNSDDQLFVGDRLTGNIFRYNEDLDEALFFTKTLYPNAMEFSQEGILYVSDSKLRAVLAIDLSGNILDTIGFGLLDFPTGIAVDDNNHRILVGEHGGSGTGFTPVVKVYMFDFDGKLVTSFGSNGNGDGQFYRIQGIEVGRCGNIYVIDPYLDRVSIFDENGNFITKFGEFGLQSGDLNVPVDLIFDRQERIVISSMNNGALEMFAISDSLPSSVILSGYQMICTGDTADIMIRFTGMPPWNFTYTVNGLNPTTINTYKNPYNLKVIQPGHYEIIALSDALGEGICFTGSADVEVTNVPPDAFVTGDAIICKGESTDVTINFTGSPPWNFTFARNGIDQKAISTTNNPFKLPVSEAGLYTVSTVQGGGCKGSSITGSAEVIVKSIPSAEILEGNTRFEIDSGNSMNFTIALSGTPPWDIVYTVDERNPVSVDNINDDNFILSASEAGTYEVELVSDRWCTGEFSKGYPEIVLKSPPPPPTAELEGGEFSICPGESVTIPVHFTGIPPWTFTYAVDTLITTTIFNTLSNPYIINAIYNGIYRIIAISDGNTVGSEFTGEANIIVNQGPYPSFDYLAKGLEVSFMNYSVSADHYEWDFGDGDTSTDSNPIHTYDASGKYVVTLRATDLECGISNEWSDTVSVNLMDLEELEFLDLLRIYPNPTRGLITLELNNKVDTDIMIEIIGIGGQVYYKNIFNSGPLIEKINLESLKAGVYFIKILSGEDLVMKKLILN